MAWNSTPCNSACCILLFMLSKEPLRLCTISVQIPKIKCLLGFEQLNGQARKLHQEGLKLPQPSTLYEYSTFVLVDGGVGASMNLPSN